MGKIGLFGAVALLSAASPAGAQRAADPVGRWRPIVAEAAARFVVPVDWIERVIRTESAGFTTLAGKPIRSPVGAIGLMQIMPATWLEMRERCQLGADPDDPRDNILAGAAYLRLMYDRFGYPGMFAAYNAGPRRYAAYLAGRSRLPAETIAYLAGITGGRSAGIVTAATPARDLLFALRRDLSPASPPVSGAATSDSMFAVRKGQR